MNTNNRINFEQALALYDMDFFELGDLADKRRQELHGKKTYFNINRHIILQMYVQIYVSSVHTRQIEKIQILTL